MPTETPSPRQFFNSLNRNQLPADIIKDIDELLLASPKLDILNEKETQEYLKVVDTIRTHLPTALAPTAKKQPEPDVTEQEAAVATAPPSKAILQSRLKLLKKMFANKPNDKTIAGRIKLVGKMIEKAS